MADFYPKVRFNDGEGIDEADFNELQHLLERQIHERAIPMPAELAAATQMARASAQGGNPHSDISGGQVLSGAALDAAYSYLPASLAGPDKSVGHIAIDGSGDLDIRWGLQSLAQLKNGSMSGTEPTSASDAMVYTLDDEEFTHLTIARPTTNPRYDSLGFRMGWGTGDNQSRDSEDAATRALSTAMVDKDDLITIASEVIQGTEAAFPTLPAHTAGYVRLMAIRRETGETSLDEDNVEYYGMPMRLAVETVNGSEIGYTTGANWDTDLYGHLQRAAIGGVDTIFAMPRRMHAGCRLVGFLINTQGMASDHDLDIGYVAYSATGVPSFTSLQAIGGGSPLSLSGDGSSFIGLDEFSFPYWGNGRTYGPLFSTMDVNPAENLPDTRLAINISPNTAWAAGEYINFVKFFFTY